MRNTLTRRLSGCLLAMIIFLAAGCRDSVEKEEPLPNPTRDISSVLNDFAPVWMAIPGVVGVAEGQTELHQPCLRIYVVKLTPELAAQLPRQAEGYPVEVEESGEITPLGGR